MDQIEPLLERANLLLEQGRYRDAEKYIRQALQQDPENDHILSMLSRCYLNSGEYDRGIEVINEAILLLPVGFRVLSQRHAAAGC